MAKRKQPSTFPIVELSEKDRADIDRIQRDILLNYEGPVDDLEKAIGILHLGYQMGWKPLVLMHSKRTVAKFEEILGIAFSAQFPPTTPSSDRSSAYRIAKKLVNFWKAVSGETPIGDRQQLTRNA